MSFLIIFCFSWLFYLCIGCFCPTEFARSVIGIWRITYETSGRILPVTHTEIPTTSLVNTAHVPLVTGPKYCTITKYRSSGCTRISGCRGCYSGFRVTRTIRWISGQGNSSCSEVRILYSVLIIRASVRSAGLSSSKFFPGAHKICNTTPLFQCDLFSFHNEFM